MLLRLGSALFLKVYYLADLYVAVCCHMFNSWSWNLCKISAEGRGFPASPVHLQAEMPHKMLILRNGPQP